MLHHVASNAKSFVVGGPLRQVREPAVEVAVGVSDEAFLGWLLSAMLVEDVWLLWRYRGRGCVAEFVRERLRVYGRRGVPDRVVLSTSD